MGSNSPPDELVDRVVAALEDAGVACMLTGSVVSGLHGRLRSTHNLDVVVELPPLAEKIRRLLAGFPEAEFYASPEAAAAAARERGMFNVIHHASGWKVDFIVRKDRPFSVSEFERRQQVPWGDRPANVATAEDTVIAKLEWHAASGSGRQLEDVAAILAVQGERLDRAYVERWVAELGLERPWAAAQAMS